MTEQKILLNRRKKLQYTQQEAAHKCGLSLREYQRFESGERKLSNAKASTFLKVCKSLQIEPFLFIEEKEDYSDWESSLFVSYVEHLYKDLAIEDFYKRISNFDLDVLFNSKDKYKLVFMLCMMDYIHNKCDFEIPGSYQIYKDLKFDYPVFPKGVEIFTEKTNNQSRKERYLKYAIPEFSSRNLMIISIEEAI